MVGVIKEGMLQGLPVVLQGPSGPTVPTSGSPDVPRELPGLGSGLSKMPGEARV